MKKIFVQAKQSVRILKVFTNSTPPLLLILTTAPGNGSGNSIINSWLASGGNGNSNINSPTGGREWNSNILVAPWTSLVCRRRRPLDFFSISDFAVGSGPQRYNEKFCPSNLSFAWFLFCSVSAEAHGGTQTFYLYFYFGFCCRQGAACRGTMKNSPWAIFSTISSLLSVGRGPRRYTNILF